MEVQSTFNKFGKKMKELCEVVSMDSNWREFVEPKTIGLVEDLYTIKNMTEIMSKNNLTYTNLRAKYLIALTRIKGQNSEGIRQGKSTKAKKLLDLMENTDGWQTALTDREINYATLFKQYKSFYEVGRILDVKPSNVAGALYGTNQRKGVTSKIEKFQLDFQKQSQSC